MTPDDPRRTCIYGHAKKCNSNFSFGKDNTLIALRGGGGGGGGNWPQHKRWITLSTGRRNSFLLRQ